MVVLVVAAAGGGRGMGRGVISRIVVVAASTSACVYPSPISVLLGKWGRTNGVATGRVGDMVGSVIW